MVLFWYKPARWWCFLVVVLWHELPSFSFQFSVGFWVLWEVKNEWLGNCCLTPEPNLYKSGILPVFNLSHLEPTHKHHKSNKQPNNTINRHLTCFIIPTSVLTTNTASSRYLITANMDYEGQKLCENLFYYIILIFGAIGWVYGYIHQDFVYVFYAWSVGMVISVVVRTKNRKSLPALSNYWLHRRKLTIIILFFNISHFSLDLSRFVSMVVTALCSRLAVL